MKKRGRRVKIEIYKVRSIEPDGIHAWVDSNVRPIKKPIKTIHQDMIAEYKEELEKGYSS